MTFVNKDKLGSALLCDQPIVGSEMKPLNVHIEGVTVCFLFSAVVHTVHTMGQTAVDEC